MEANLLIKHPYEAPEVEIVNVAAEDSILAFSDYWSEPID
jgi:hypothetical protein